MAESSDKKGDDTAEQQASNGSHGEDDAAKTIQRNYRGYKSRREMNGCGMSAQFRWRELLKDGIKYRLSHT
jgi:hypothetical protein